MFTIKHVSPSGSEFAIEAESYFVEYDRPANLVRITCGDKQYRDGDYTGFWAGVPRNSGGPDAHTIYVMNGHGSTIAQHHFTESPPDHFNIGAEQVDPDKIAA